MTRSPCQEQFEKTPYNTIAGRRCDGLYSWYVARFPRLHLTQSTCKLSTVSLPPLLRGTTWSICKLWVEKHDMQRGVFDNMARLLYFSWARPSFLARVTDVHSSPLLALALAIRLSSMSLWGIWLLAIHSNNPSFMLPHHHVIMN